MPTDGGHLLSPVVLVALALLCLGPILCFKSYAKRPPRATSCQTGNRIHRVRAKMPPLDCTWATGLLAISPPTLGFQAQSAVGQALRGAVRGALHLLPSGLDGGPELGPCPRAAGSSAGVCDSHRGAVCDPSVAGCGRTSRKHGGAAATASTRPAASRHLPFSRGAVARRVGSVAAGLGLFSGLGTSGCGFGVTPGQPFDLGPPCIDWKSRADIASCVLWLVGSCLLHSEVPEALHSHVGMGPVWGARKSAWPPSGRRTTHCMLSTAVF